MIGKTNVDIGRLVKVCVIVLSGFVGLSFLAIDAQALQPSLENIHEKIERRYPALRHISADDFEKLDHEALVIFDVRKQSEYEVSHIDGAIRVAPGLSRAAFLQSYGDQLHGKKAVFYCSVGRRSSALASRVQTQLEARGINEIYNLEGGIFRWRNEERQLVQGDKYTQSVHPYNAYWGRLINDKTAIRYQPD